MLSTLAAKLGFGVSIKALGEAFAPLAPFSDHHGKLPERIYNFIRDGSTPEVLLQLQNNPALDGKLLGRPGRLWSGTGSYSHDGPQHNAVVASIKARVTFYKLFNMDNTGPEPLIRLGKVLAAIDKGQSLETTGFEAPDWLHYLLNDLLVSQAGLSNSWSNKAPDLPDWRIAWLVKVLEAEQLPPAMAFLAQFESKALSYYQTNPLLYLQNWPDSSAWLVAQADVVRSHVAKLSAGGRVNLATAIGKSPELGAAFTDVLVRLAVDSGKTVRDAACQRLGQLPQAQRIAELGKILHSAGNPEKVQAIGLLARESAPGAQQLLEQALTAQPTRAVEQALQSALGRVELGQAASTQVLPDLPAVPELVMAALSDSVLALLQQNRRDMLPELEQAAQAEKTRNALPETQYKADWARKALKAFQALGDDAAAKIFRTLNAPPANQKNYSHEECHLLHYKGRLANHPELQLVHALMLQRLTGRLDHFWFGEYFQGWLKRQMADAVDLRHLAQAFKHLDLPIRPIANAFLQTSWIDNDAMNQVRAAQIWPFFAERPEYLEQALGMRGYDGDNRFGNYDLDKGLRVLATFPLLPQQYVARVLELALGDGKTHRLAAQELASRLPNIITLISEQLHSGKQEQRIVAAEWLTRIAAKPAIPALYAALDKEKSETARAALLTALETLGEDIQRFLTPEVLKAEADKGLKGKIPAALADFPFAALPAVRWAAVPADPQQAQPGVAAAIIQWWVMLAFKLKDPGGNALLERYLGLLDAADAAQLGRFILHCFIELDTRNPSNEEALAHARANCAATLAMYQGWASHAPEFANKTEEQVFEELRRAKAATYIGSAIALKGILALCSRAAGHELVRSIRNFMRDHYTRSAQIMALLEAAAAGGDALVIQLLLAVARRYRTAGVQERAKQLVQMIAERKAWSHEQLADRTIPSAFFDDSGVLALDYGGRELKVVLASNAKGELKPVLRNADGKELKTLPEPRKNDDPASIKEAKNLFAACKKELRQVLDLQSARLYEAMCSNRQWPLAEWREYLAAHPVAGRLVQQLVWQAHDANGTLLATFRPSEDGSLIDLQDDEIELPPDCRLRLAHASTVPDAKAWITHLKDYKVPALFDQFGRPQPGPVAAEADHFDQREGWLSDAFTLRGQLSKLGYQRAAAEDGGFFNHYFKEFGSAGSDGNGIRVCINFSGNCLPEENVAAALTTLHFESMRGNRWNSANLLLADLPPVLRSEAWADYVTVANSALHDADWQKKVPW